MYRLRKWQDVFGDRTAWPIISDGMRQHGYKAE